MTIEQLIKLIDAGFTREEISVLVNTTEPAQNPPQNTNPAQNNQTTEPAQNNQTTEPAQNNQNTEPTPNQNNTEQNTNQMLINTINKLTQTIQASNIGRSQMGSPLPPPTADEVLASIIAPNNR